MCKMKSFFVRAESAAVKTFASLLGIRPSSAPYLSGDTFRAIADHVYERGRENSFDPSEVRKGDIVFCEAWEAKAFLEGPNQDVKESFVLITGNGDPNIGEAYAGLIRDKPAAWFAQNLDMEHPKAFPLPIGLENAAKHWHGNIGDFKRLRRGLPEKRNRILYGFTVGTNENERKPALEALERHPAADRLAPVNTRAYKRILAGYSFVASPPGNGLDCHRTWEALYLNVVPIVRRSIMTEKFAQELPLWLIDDWRELEDYGEQELTGKYDELWNGPWNREALWFPYWENKIRSLAVK